MYPLGGTDRHAVFMRGERVTVVGPSPRRGYLMVDRRGITVNVPSNIMEVAPPVRNANRFLLENFLAFFC